MKKILLFIISLFVSISATYAVIAYNKPITVTQPDGTTLTIRVHGDEFLHWTTCGNSLVAKGTDGYWRYATFNADGVAKAQGARVQSNMSGDGSSVTPPAPAIAKALKKRQSMTKKSANASPSISQTSLPLSTGNPHFLILLIEFADKSFTMPKENFTDLLSGENYTYNGATGSVNRYYQDVSFGKFNPQFDVVGPIKVSYTSAECAEDDVDAVIEACTFAHDSLGVNFTQYCNKSPNLVDNVFFFFPGYNQAEGGGDDTIWPHAVTYAYPFLTLDGVGIYHYGCASEFKGESGETMAGIGTFCHEFGHVIGLPDFYDVDYEANGSGLALVTLSLMSSGNYNNGGRTPPYFTYEEKHILGWDEGLTLLAEGNNTLEPTSTNKAYYSPTATEGEYFLYESRPCEGWDTYTDAPGMAIYHVDKSGYMMPNGYSAAKLWEFGYMINAFASHQCMDLVETVYPESSVQYIDECTFPGYNNVMSFTSSTKPSARSWSGTPTGYNISNIKFDSTSGSTTFTMERERKIVGTVSNTAHQPLPGTEVVMKFVSSLEESVKKVSSVGNGLSIMNLAASPNAPEYRVTTDANGYFEVDKPQPGIYSVSVNKEGYAPYTSSVTADGMVELNIVLATPADMSGVTLKKYSVISSYAVGIKAGVDHYAGLNYTADELAEYVGFPIQSVSFMAGNGGNGTADKVGVQVYFGNELQCDCECTEPIYGTLCTVDVSSYKLKIPSGKSVTFVYYLLNPSYGYPFILADYGMPVTGANLINNTDDLDWYAYPGGNVVLSATIINGSQVLDLSGINYIPHKQAYTAGETFELTLTQSSVNPPASVTWTVNGEEASGSVVLTKGVCTVRACVTYESGRQETIETKLNVVE
ncbi:MAG: M6 family metalloprotease domain-containing protein [Bacteroidales bacterium]|nr:M6 family metalloprotease domain-containing protein [Bacteroidales bacterium]